MKLKHTLLSIFIILTSCSKDSKKNLSEISALKDSISIIQKNAQDSLIKKITSINELKSQKDSIIGLLKKTNSIKLTNEAINNQITFSDSLIISGVINDDYSTRGVYYTSKNKQENLYNVKVSTVNNHTRFYFIGLKLPLNSKNVIANIYELNKDKTIYKIDSFNLFVSEKEKNEFLENIDDKTQKNIHLIEFMLLHLDNLIVKNGRLYYYKVLEYTRDSFQLKIAKKQYYEYFIGSKSSSKKISHPIHSSLIIDGADNIMLVNPQRSIIATNFGVGIFFNKINNWTKTFSELYMNDNADLHVSNDLTKLSFNLTNFLPDIEEDDMYYDPETKKNVLIGGINWHSRKNKFYFDNSGMTYRCIWEIDFDKNKLTKIVPEHEAIHPFFFEINGIEHIAYVEENKIMVCNLYH